MRICILVAAHKDFDDSFLDHGYKVIKVGESLDDTFAEKRHWLRDNVRDHISEKNSYYCELTGLYWGWKNLDLSIKYVGLSHYRRYFCTYRKKDAFIGNNILTAEEAESYLQKYKVILPYSTVKTSKMFRPVKTRSLIE